MFFGWVVTVILELAAGAFRLTFTSLIAVAAYTEKYGALPEGATVTEPKFTTKNFTGKLVVSYTVYYEPAVDEMQVACFKKAAKITLTGDLSFILQQIGPDGTDTDILPQRAADKSAAAHLHR